MFNRYFNLFIFFLILDFAKIIQDIEDMFSPGSRNLPTSASYSLVKSKELLSHKILATSVIKFSMFL